MNETPISLLDRIRSKPDDQPSWRRLTSLYEPLIRRWILRHDTPEADADDLAQEVFLVLAREIGEFDHNGRTGAFRHWVRSVTANKLRGYWRSRRHLARTGLDERLDLFERVEAESELSRELDREHDRFIASRLIRIAESEFSPTTWESFRLQVLDGLPAATVADRLGLSVNAVLISKSRVLKRLREEAKGLIS